MVSSTERLEHHMKATKKNVAAAIFEKHGHKVELVKGNGYFYFSSDEADYRLAPITYAHGTSVYVNGLWCFDVERWVSEYETLIEDVIVPENATEELTTKIIVLQSPNNVY
jgi:hypothetical protein